ncbi:MAG: cysteine hydrolase [SAR202 cluster bacterium]|nr:cysteine hydrolase [SAR202 cluster bacterium]
MTDVLLVVDMVKGFLEPGHNLYCGDAARRIIPAVRRLIEAEHRTGSQVIYFHDTHRPDDLEFRMFPVHCLAGSRETELVEELGGLPGEHVAKARYSAFYGTDLEQRLAVLKPNRVTICGVCTDICVMHTAADARNRDYEVTVRLDCVASFDAEQHRWALRHMQKVLGVRVAGGE